MTPEERDLVNDLFDRLAALENSQREPEAERAIQEGLKRAPHAVYALVQTALVQDEALKRADARIHDLEAQLGNQAEPPRAAGGFLGSMREALTGRRGSVPSVRPGDAPMAVPPDYRGPPPPPMGAAPAFGGPGRGGGSFLGTAAAAAAGAIGGSLMLDSIRGMMGHQHGIGGSGSTPGAALAGEPGSPWAAAPSGGNLAREAGIDDIGRRDQGGGSQGQPASDSDRQLAGDDDTQQAADADYQDEDDYQDDGDIDADSGDFDGGGDFGGGGDE